MRQYPSGINSIGQTSGGVTSTVDGMAPPPYPESSSIDSCSPPRETSFAADIASGRSKGVELYSSGSNMDISDRSKDDSKGYAPCCWPSWRFSTDARKPYARSSGDYRDILDPESSFSAIIKSISKQSFELKALRAEYRNCVEASIEVKRCRYKVEQLSHASRFVYMAVECVKRSENRLVEIKDGRGWNKLKSTVLRSAAFAKAVLFMFLRIIGAGSDAADQDTLDEATMRNILHGRDGDDWASFVQTVVQGCSQVVLNTIDINSDDTSAMTRKRIKQSVNKRICDHHKLAKASAEEVLLAALIIADEDGEDLKSTWGMKGIRDEDLDTIWWKRDVMKSPVQEGMLPTEKTRVQHVISMLQQRTLKEMDEVVQYALEILGDETRSIDFLFLELPSSSGDW